MRQFGAWFIAALALGTGGAQAQPVSQAQQLAQGHELALMLCSVCHVAAVDQTEPPQKSNAGPPFVEIANNPQATPAALRTFLHITHSSTTPPFTMPNLRLTDQQTDAMITYITSLRTQQ